MTNYQPTDTYPSSMTIVSNDPSFWPVIYLIRFLSYFFGSCLSRRIVLVMSQSSQFPPLLRCYTITVSDLWRIWEIAEILIVFPVLTIGKEVSGYEYHYWSIHLAKGDDIDWIDLGEQSSISQEQQIIQDRVNAGHWWLSYTSVCLTYVSAVGKLCWL